MFKLTRTALATSLALFCISNVAVSAESGPLWLYISGKDLTADEIHQYGEVTNFTLASDANNNGYKQVIRASCYTPDMQTYGPVVKLVKGGSVNYSGNDDRTVMLVKLERAGKLEVGSPDQYADSFKLHLVNEGNGRASAVEAWAQRFHKEGSTTVVEPNLFINAKEIDIDVSGNSENEVRGIAFSSNNLAILNGENIRVNIKNKKESETCAFFASNKATLEINGNLNVTADSVIYARGTGEDLSTGLTKIEINKYNNSSVQLNGDITFYKDTGADATKCDAMILVNLTSEDSYWRGTAKKGWNVVGYPNNKKPIPPTDSSDINAHNLHLYLDNGATWYVEDIKRTEDLRSKFEAIPLNYLTFGDNGGVVDLNVKEARIEDVNGNGFVNIHTNDGIAVDNKLIIDNNNNSSFSVIAREITSDHIVSPEKFGDEMMKAVETADGKQIASTAFVREGEIYGEINAVRQDDGQVLTTVSENPKIKSYRAANLLTMLNLRQEGEDLTKRLGQIREEPGSIGAWVRVTGNELEHDASGIKLESTTVQIGADKAINSDWTLGGAFFYTDGETKGALGKADHESYGVAAYATYVNDNGNFIDLTAKMNYLDNEFTFGTLKGSYDTYAAQISTEIGKTFKVTPFWYVEPQIQATYGWVDGKSFTTSNGVQIVQDDLESLVGRVGVKSGLQLPNDWGNIYARVSYANDFEGSADGTAKHIRAKANLDTDIGGDWMEYGIGCNINIAQNMYSYFDFEMTDGGKVEENYRWNVGLRKFF